MQGILAAANARPGSHQPEPRLGRQRAVDRAGVYEAIAKGTLVVAASGNDGDRGNPLDYPASLPHVLTVGASDRTNGIAFFSSRSRFVDLVAPGVGLPIATAVGKGWQDGDGTSFAAPLVSGASAWVWTVRPELDATQLFEVMRQSAVDVGAPGRDDAAGFGLLNVPAALVYPAPLRDPFEPNDDIEFVRPGGLYDNFIPALTTRTQRAGSVEARLDRVEDPRDVYRVWLPQRRTHHSDADSGRERRPEPLEPGHGQHPRANRGHRPARARRRRRNVGAADVHEQGRGPVRLPRRRLPEGRSPWPRTASVS